MTKYDYDVFIFYNRDDHDSAAQLDEQLTAKGIKVFFERRSLLLGIPRKKQLDEAVQKSMAGIVFFGAYTLTDEYEQLLDQARPFMDIIIPVTINGDTCGISSQYPFLRDRPGAYLIDETSINRIIQTIKAASKPANYLPYEISNFVATCYLRRLELTNIRGFDSLDLDLDAPPREQSLIIGRNGTCKTSILRCIALVLAGDKDAQALLSSPNGRWITNGEKEGLIRLHLEPLNGDEPAIRELRIVKDNGGELARSENQTSDTIFACAYGTSRGNFGDEPGRDYRVMDSVATLFDYGERLVPSELVLRRLHDFLGSQRFDAILFGLKQALGLSSEHSIELPRGGGVEISGPNLGGRIPLEAWADGYRMTFSWLIDFYGWAMRAGAFDEDGNVRGILLVDEIEQHLHPAMQREILGHLAEALPKVQIIATTHSPLVALSSNPEQIIALHRNGEHVTNVVVPPLIGYSTDDILIEDALFGTSPYPPATEAQLGRYRPGSEVASTS